MTSQRDGYVYVLSNISMPGLVKIGKSRRGGRFRAKEIYQTGVPTPFKLEYEVYTQDCDSLESYVHESLDHVRTNDSREFFNLTVENAVIAITRVYLGDYGETVICEDLYDVGANLADMVDKSEIEYNSFGDVLSMNAALRFIDPDAINKALKEHNKWLKECAERRKQVSDNV